MKILRTSFEILVAFLVVLYMKYTYWRAKRRAGDAAFLHSEEDCPSTPYLLWIGADLAARIGFLVGAFVVVVGVVGVLVGFFK